MNDEALIGRLSTDREDLPRQIRALQEYIGAGDTKSAERQAHTIAAHPSMSVASPARGGFEIEKAARAGDLIAVTARMPELKTQFDRLKEAMTANPVTRTGNPALQGDF